MATISGASNEKVYSISKWGGLNEHPDGDTRLKLGEASKMINWKITRDGNLKRRAGFEIVLGLLNQYKEERADTLLKIAEYDSGDTKITVYNNISTRVMPGVISPVGETGDIELGVWKGKDINVTNGMLSKTAENIYSVNEGKLVIADDSNFRKVTITDLIAELKTLPLGTFRYVSNGEAIYAIKDGSIVREGNTYILYGYLMTAVPVSDTEPVKGMWSGYAGGKPVFLAACAGNIWSLYNADKDRFERDYLGSINTDKGVNFVPFGGNVYIQNGYEYYVYDGESLSVVAGYRPLVAIAIGPMDTDTDGDGVPDTASQAGTLTGEYVNRLNGNRRCWISGDGEHASFKLPEAGLASLDWVTDLASGEPVHPNNYTVDLAKGIVTFNTAPMKAVNGWEIGYSMSVNYREQVTGHLFAELYSGNTDTALFFYGDGTNKTIYTGMDYDGMPRADYFPDQYEALIGDGNTPITSMIRHGGALICYKTSECWSLSFAEVELATGDLTPAVYITPVNRAQGNVAPGQVRLVNNNPVTCSNAELYQWINSSYYTSNLTRDERQAKRISDRIQKSIKEIDLPKCIMWDDDDNQEFYLVQDGVALVWNYAQDVWYRYSGFNVSRMCNFQGTVYIGTPEGSILRQTYNNRTDAGNIIQAEWESGAIDFGASNIRKYSSMMWVGLKPEDGTSVDVCVETDRKNTFREKVVSSTKAKVPGEPFAVRSKIKAKKFVYYRLLLSVNEIMPAVTVTNVDFRVRQTGYAK